jgi:hypothetical protein
VLANLRLEVSCDHERHSGKETNYLRQKRLCGNSGKRRELMKRRELKKKKGVKGKEGS